MQIGDLVRHAVDLESGIGIVVDSYQVLSKYRNDRYLIRWIDNNETEWVDYPVLEVISESRR